MKTVAAAIVFSFDICDTRPESATCVSSRNGEKGKADGA